MKDKSISIYYDSEETDLIAMIKKLQTAEETRFEGRSVSEIARMILREGLEREVAKLTSPSPTQNRT